MINWISLLIVVIGLCSSAYAASIVIDKTSLIDPTRPDYIRDSSAEGGVEEYKLSAIFISANRKIATINGKLVKEGDYVGNAKVILISSNTVQLEGASGKITLVLINQLMKQQKTTD